MIPLVDSVMLIDKSITAAKIRSSHLAKDGFYDPQTNFFIKEGTAFKKKLLKPIADFVKQHPAYKWFSRIKGIGNENIAKVISLINIEKSNTMSGLWKFAGYATDQNGKAEKRSKGEKLPFNMTLKVMCNRLGTSLLKASAVGEASHYGLYYAKEYAKYKEFFEERGVIISDFNKIPKKATIVTCKANAVKGGYMQSLHLHQLAFRKMIKLFLAHLWQVWREAENLPIRPPYAIEKMGHTTLIDPWEMIDRPEKRTRKSKAA